MVLAWTNADIRYRFRIQTAPIPLKTITFWTISWVGILTLLTDIWFVEHWMIPEGKLITPAIWQGMLAVLFLTIFLVWTWYAFISPPKYSKLNAKRFARAIYKSILRGSQEELAVIADELQESLASIVFNAQDREQDTLTWLPDDNRENDPKNPEYILELMAGKRFCRAIIASSPTVALMLFQELQRQNKFGIQVSNFSRNLINEAISNKDSFLFHENTYYKNGLLGQVKPYSQAIFGNYDLIKEIGSLFEMDAERRKNWDGEQWKAYFELLLVAIQSYAETSIEEHSNILCRALNIGRDALIHFPTLTGLGDANINPELLKLTVTVDFIEKAIKVLEDNECPKWHQRRPDYHGQESFYDRLADFIYEVIHATSHVRAPQALCLLIQYEMLWKRLFTSSSSYANSTPVSKYIRRRVYRYLYDEIRQLRHFGYSYTAFSILGYCLNVLELETSFSESFDNFRKTINPYQWTFRKVVLGWTKKHYAQLYSKYPIPADRCLAEGIRYDKENFKILKVRQSKYDASAELEYLQVQPFLEQIPC